jgi:hypothetical protein
MLAERLKDLALLLDGTDRGSNHEGAIEANRRAMRVTNRVGRTDP